MSQHLNYVLSDPYGDVCLVGRLYPASKCAIYSIAAGEYCSSFDVGFRAPNPACHRILSAQQLWCGIDHETENIVCVDLAAKRLRWLTNVIGADVIVADRASGHIFTINHRNEWVQIRVEDGSIVESGLGIKDIFSLDPDGHTLFVNNSGGASVHNRGIVRYQWQFDKYRSKQDVLGAILVQDRLVITWVRGGITVHDVRDGTIIRTIGDPVWANDLIWSNELGLVLATGSIERYELQMLFGFDIESGKIVVIDHNVHHLPLRGINLCNNAKNAVIAVGHSQSQQECYLQSIETGEVHEFTSIPDESA